MSGSAAFAGQPSFPDNETHPPNSGGHQHSRVKKQIPEFTPASLLPPNDSFKKFRRKLYEDPDSIGNPLCVGYYENNIILIHEGHGNT